VFFTALVPGSVAGWLPWWIAGTPTLALGTTRIGARVAGAVLTVIGWTTLVWCAVDFARRGRGTPAPYDPPRALVYAGLYRYTRNPMYVAVVTATLGQALWYQSRAVVGYAIIVALLFHAMIVLYEEPHLARVFGPAYLEYRARVPRWLPGPRRRG
jgi:protein-S-isoprenylcysteine O-methyltransferase Ste14